MAFVMPLATQPPPGVSPSEEPSGQAPNLIGINLSDLNAPELCAAVSADTGIPQGRVNKVVLALQRHLASGGAPQTSGQIPGQILAEPEQKQEPENPLRFYPIGANGSLRPPSGRAE